MNLITRGLAAAALLALPLSAATPVVAAPEPGAASTSLTDGIRALPVAAEDQSDYSRTSFRHWVDEDHDGCNTRMEVLIAESRVEPTVEPGCKVTSGEWFSYYDQRTHADSRGLDIDHMVALGEAWDSGAAGWTAERRQAYANDLGAETSLVAVTGSVNRSKGERDPAEWMPPSADARCTYLAEWVGTKLRWQLTADQAERDALARIAAGCGRQSVEYTVAP